MYGNWNKRTEIIGAGKKITSENEDFSTGLSPYINYPSAGSLKKLHENQIGFTESLAANANNVQIEVISCNFDITKHLDSVQEGTTSRPKKRKLTDKTFRAYHNIDGLVEAFDDTNKNNLKCETPKNRSLESAHVEMWRGQFGLVAVRSPVPEVGCSSPINANEYFSDYQLLTFKTKELNRQVESLPKWIVDEIKKKRRALKNRGYARSSRDKKNNETNNLKEINESLEKELATKRQEIAEMKLERDKWKEKYQKLDLQFKSMTICAI